MSELGLTSYITALFRLFRTQAQAGLGRRYEKEKTAEGETKDRTKKRQYREMDLCAPPSILKKKRSEKKSLRSPQQATHKIGGNLLLFLRENSP